MESLHRSAKEFPVKKLFYASLAYMVLGVASGLYYRELTKANDFSPNSFTQLSVVHTHLLVLGFVVLLLVLVLEKVFTLSNSKLFAWFFWVYNAGLVITAGMLAVHGTMTVLGADVSPAISGVAGMGHILLAIAMVMLFVTLGSRLGSDAREGAVTAR
jgi:hypothetical protein